MAGIQHEGNEERVVLCRLKVMYETTETATIASRDQGDEKIAASANALGQVDALLEIFNGLMRE